MTDMSDSPPADAETLESASEPDAGPDMTLTVAGAGATHTFRLPSGSTVADLTAECGLAWGPEFDWTGHKFIAPAPVGLLKPAAQPDLALPASLDGKKLRLMTSKLRDVDALAAAAQASRHLAQRRDAQLRAQRHVRNRLGKDRAPSRRQQDGEFAFLTVRALPHLPRPERSRALLDRLAADPGIRQAMRAHRFTVGLLTEMEPLSNTQSTHEGTTRLLGLNRNGGEVIELRLRTDAYDGYRDYRTIRKTLCHELAHNVHGPHDRQFWDLCHQIEREVDKADWTHGGRTVGDGPTYQPAAEPEEGDIDDHGGWTGGEFVLGGGGSGGAEAAGAAPLSRREILARAAEERQKRLDRAASRRPDDAEGSDSGAA